MKIAFTIFLCSAVNWSTFQSLSNFRWCDHLNRIILIFFQSMQGQLLLSCTFFYHLNPFWNAIIMIDISRRCYFMSMFVIHIWIHIYIYIHTTILIPVQILYNYALYTLKLAQKLKKYKKFKKLGLIFKV